MSKNIPTRNKIINTKSTVAIIDVTLGKFLLNKKSGKIIIDAANAIAKG